MTTRTKARSAMEARANRWRLLQAATVMALFRRTHGRDATSPDELGRWARRALANVAKPIDPFAVLTADELEIIKRECPDLFDRDDER